MKKVLFFICLLWAGVSFGQIDLSTASGNGEWRVGGTAGLSFGNNSYFGVSVAPFVGYRVSSYVEPGVTAGYRYAKSDFIQHNLFHFGPYVNFYPVNNLFLRAQYEYYLGKLESETTDYSQDISENALWLGGGYRSGGPVQVYVGVQYNVLYDDGNSLFSNGLRPIVGVSFSI